MTPDPTPEAERARVEENISLAWVNGHITAQEAAQAHDALTEHWAESESE